MKDNLTELVFILDRSGSMSGLESDTIGGFNSMIERQKNQYGEAFVTTVLFDDKYELLHDRVEIKKLQKMTDKEYYVCGCTALLDAVGKTINKIKAVHENMDENDKPQKTIFVITTDGYENASQEYSYKMLREMIETQKEKYGWEFIFLGANIDAVKEAEKFGITEDRAATYKNDKRGIKLNYEVLSDTLDFMRSCERTIGSEWKNKIEEDLEHRQ
ncbi:MAG: VWA domain-containing protein [Clostridium sp.]|nr:VWA domain-containing protein [Clostridium sp.]